MKKSNLKTLSRKELKVINAGERIISSIGSSNCQAYSGCSSGCAEYRYVNDQVFGDWYCSSCCVA